MSPSPAGGWREVCSVCGRTWALADRRWRCICGGLLDLIGPLGVPVAPEGWTGSGRSGGSGTSGGSGGSGGPGPGGSPLRRYRAALPPGADRVDLGLVVTPVHELQPGLFVKADYEHPTGSFKDRGAAVMIGGAAAIGVGSVIVDSSGNAGRAAAAHAARAGMECTVFLPAGTAPAKVDPIASFGAEVVEVAGGRPAAAAAAQQAVGATGRWYASHVHQPLFHHGVKTLAFEIHEQVPGIERGVVVVPAGNGTLVLGLWLGFGELWSAGHIDRRPALVAVQADRCAPLAGLAPPEGPTRGPKAEPTAAAGIAIPDPPRAGQIRAAVAASGGWVAVAGEEAILAARSELHSLGFPVEPTGAVAWVEARRLAWAVGPVGGPVGGPVVAVLTGR